MNEAFLQYIWQHKLLEEPLVTTDGQPLKVMRSGDLNLDAGPDFFNAHISIGSLEWVGSVEVHIHSSDWNRHGHSDDKSYDNVVLHVVYEHDADIVMSNGRTPPTLELRGRIPGHVLAHYEALMNPPSTAEVPCAQWLKSVPPFTLHSWMERLTVERIERKTADVERLLNHANGSWTDCCYLVVARYFGGRTNAFAFEMLAKATPLGVVAKIKDDLFRVEALLFGQAGMLEQDFDDDYPLRLQTEYRYMRKAYNLTPIDGTWWKFFRLRPSVFPTLRISQFAALLHRSHGLFSQLLDNNDAALLRHSFEVEASAYWRDHYRFDRPSKAAHGVQTGEAMACNLIINAWVPLLFEYGVKHDDESLRERAYLLLQQLPPEDNNIVRMWKGLGVEADSAAQSQALIQLHNEYCGNKKCLNCHLGSRILRIVEPC